ncbi:hypothetical protein Fmac_016393 [Flemingia macrophylla]|uniref:Uncharacterized protein n=1 Tax=Flemingia macrophylla TaxID=520843 RepID=A0ABD1MJF5_9FABA
MSGIVRAALRSKCGTGVCTFVQRSRHGFPVRCFSTEAEQHPLNSFLDTGNSGVTYGKLLGTNRHTLKTDIINYLEGCNLTMEDVKMDYNRSFFPVSMFLQFPTRDSYDNAIRVIVRKGRVYKLEMADRSQWDQVTPYDGKTILIQGVPLLTSFEDIRRIMSGYEYDSSSINIFLRSSDGAYPIKIATVRFHSRTQAMNAYLAKNGTFCLNNRISIRVLQ